MILRIPDYFEDFHCLGEACPDTCCIGWELEIDEATYDYYRSVPGAFGRRLRAAMADAAKDGEAARTFCLKVDGRCPFLNRQNLCEIVLELGPEALPEVCTEYPRRTFSFGPYITRSLTLSCPEVARMLLTSEPPVHFPEVDLSERVLADTEITVKGDGSPEPAAAGDASDDPSDAPGEDAEGLPADFTAKVRDRAIGLLEDRGRAFADRLGRFLRYAEAVQQGIDAGLRTDGQLFSMEETGFERCGYPAEKPQKESPEDLRAAFAKRLELLEKLEAISPRWEKERAALSAMAGAPPFPEFYDDVRAEHLMTYYTDRYFPLAWYDGDLLGKTRFAVFSLLVQMDLLTLRARKRGEKPGAQDWIEVVSLYSAEVENSEYNTELLLEALGQSL